MKFLETGLCDAYIIELEELVDDRGSFARSYCAQEFEARGLNPRFVQCNISYNTRKGTLRGMHYQIAPHSELKLVRCVRGSIYDVIVDLRPESPTHGNWVAVELSAENRRSLCVPEDFAHGFVTLEDHSEVHYQMSEFYQPWAAQGFRWNDPRFAITWPFADPIISTRDQSYPDFAGLPSASS